MAKKGRRPKKGGRPAAARSRRAPREANYFVQPGRRGVFVVARRPIGNRATPKICGEMPTQIHAKILIQNLERAESVVKDLFMEATDDGIEALEAVLAACRTETMRRGPRVSLPERGSVMTEGSAGDANP